MYYFWIFLRLDACNGLDTVALRKHFRFVFRGEKVHEHVQVNITLTFTNMNLDEFGC